VPAAAYVARKLTQARAWNASSGLVGTLGAIGLVPFIKPGLEPEYWYQDPTPYLLGVVVGALAGVMSAHAGRAPEWIRHRASLRPLENRASRWSPGIETPEALRSSRHP
jgi:peptidoglycan/LPS O-acetylase OafA/YrhL